jgi:hypothetical protein
MITIKYLGTLTYYQQLIVGFLTIKLQTQLQKNMYSEVVLNETNI